MNNLSKNFLLLVVAAIVLMLVFQGLSPRTLGGTGSALTYDQFVTEVQDGRVSEVTISEDRVTINGVRKDGSKFVTHSPGDPELVKDLINYDVKTVQVPPSSGRSFFVGLLFNLLPIALLIGVWLYFMRQMQQGGGKGAMSFGRSRAKLLNEDQTKATFADVAGCD